MHITVAGKQVDTGEALRTHVREGLSTISRKYFDYALEANVTFRRDRAFFACDINLKAGRNLFVRSEGEGPDAHRAFEAAAEHLAKRLRRYRRRVNDHARSFAEDRGTGPEAVAATAEAAPETARQYVLRQTTEEEEEDEEERRQASSASRVDGDGGGGADGGRMMAAASDDHGGAIIAEMPAEIERLTVGEAVMRMDLAQAPVLMFRNRATGTLNVVYRRPDGHVGWIDPASA